MTECCDRFHDDEREPCLWEACQLCGGPYAFGAAPSKWCTSCTEAEGEGI